MLMLGHHSCRDQQANWLVSGSSLKDLAVLSLWHVPLGSDLSNGHSMELDRGQAQGFSVSYTHRGSTLLKRSSEVLKDPPTFAAEETLGSAQNVP